MSELPANEEVRYGAVIRPPWFRLENGRFESDQPVNVDACALDSLPGRYQVVERGAFVGIVADTPDRARIAAQRLIVEWSSSPRSPTSTEPCAVGGIDYAWPNRMRFGPGAGWVIADARPGRVRLWAPSQTSTALREDIARLLDRPLEQIELHQALADGLGRTGADDAAADAALLSAATGAPVAVWLDRSYAADGERLGPGQRIALSDTMVDGNLRGLEARLHQTSDAAPALALLLAGLSAADPMPRQPLSIPYTALDWKIEAPDQPGYRLPGLGATQLAFARESYLDELAHRLGQDPVALRLAALEDPRGRALIEAVAARAGWSARRRRSEHPEISCGRGFAYGEEGPTGDPRRARAAWIADVEVNRITGDIALTRLVLGQESGERLDQEQLRAELQRQLIERTSPLLANSAGAQEWGEGEEPRRGPFFIEHITLPPISDQTLSTSLGGAGLCALDAGTLAPSVAVISNALFDATGVRLREPPFSPERVRTALAEHAPAASAGPRALPGGVPGARSRPWRKKRWVAASLLPLAGAAVALWPFKPAIAPIQRPPADLYSAATLERGRLVAEVGDCAVCHTAPGGETNAGGHAFETPFGTLYSTNLTPDEETGIGGWSFAAFERAMRHGVGRDGRQLYPAFPYTAYAKLSDTDMQALYAYLMSRPAVNATPPENQLRAPFNFRPLLAGWNALFHDPTPFQPDPTKSVQYNRGAYLVEGPGHCSACHTPRNLLGAERGAEARFSGAIVDGWEAPALNGLSSAPVPWTEADLYAYLREGSSPHHGAAGGPMAPVVAGLAELPEEDVRAIAHYVASLSGPLAATVEDTAAAAAERIQAAELATPMLDEGGRSFERACAACHESALPGPTSAQVSLALNTNVSSARPDNLIQTMLDGVHAEGMIDSALMPSFRDSLSDTQIAAIARYVRARYAPGQPAWQDLDERIVELRGAGDD